MLSKLLLGLGLVLVLEGIPYFASPGGMKRLLLAVRELDEASLRRLGLGAMLAGVALVYFSERLAS